MSDVELTFRVASNVALLLMTCHELLTGEAPDNSVAGCKHRDWLMDELHDAIKTFDEHDALDERVMDRKWEARRDFVLSLGLSSATSNVLLRGGIDSLEQLKDITSGKLSVFGCGEKRRHELRDALATMEAR